MNRNDDFYNDLSPFYVAIESNDIDAVKNFIAQGVDLDYLGEGLPSSVSLASRFGHIEIVEFLLDANANLDNDCLIQAASNNHEGVVALLLDRGADPKASHFTVSGGEIAAIHGAAESGNIEIAKLLLQHGADVNQKGGFFGEAQPLSYAAMEGNAEMVEFLLDHGAQIETYHANALTDLDPSLNASFVNAIASSALFSAIFSGDKATFNLLLEKGVDQNLGLSPVHIAVIRGDVEGINTLFNEQGDMNATDALGIKPIHYAALFSDTASISALIEAGADLNATFALDLNAPVSPLQIAMGQFGLEGMEAEMGEGAAEAIAILTAHGAVEAPSLSSTLNIENVLDCGEPDMGGFGSPEVQQPNMITYLPMDPIAQSVTSSPIDVF